MDMKTPHGTEEGLRGYHKRAAIHEVLLKGRCLREKPRWVFAASGGDGPCTICLPARPALPSSPSPCLTVPSSPASPCGLTPLPQKHSTVETTPNPTETPAAARDPHAVPGDGIQRWQLWYDRFSVEVRVWRMKVWTRRSTEYTKGFYSLPTPRYNNHNSHTVLDKVTVAGTNIK
ncbi:hypothetical protein E2C01_069057 [Portunus trituberculatus]|uniref:Uncharacterized protein n=1 Tax=Portunus trituberculatus TaxID=210409 RepID=A0A5B7HXW4_PORTR|nr:hypothetical protein [Portunus trituberculatus]